MSGPGESTNAKPPNSGDGGLSTRTALILILAGGAQFTKAFGLLDRVIR